MKINNLTEAQQLVIIDEASKKKPQILFKHSTHCNISADALEEINKSDFEIWFLDLLAYRSVSDEIAYHYNIIHKSPQILVIQDGKCIYNESHWRIKNEIIAEVLK